jgi:PAS domain S-box-containing protein
MTPRQEKDLPSADADLWAFEKKRGPFVLAVEHTRMAMLFADARQEGSPIIFANDSFLDLSGYRREEVIGRHLNFILSSHADDHMLLHMQRALAGEVISGAELLCTRKSGKKFWASFFINPLRDDQGHIAYYFASFVDLTDHKEEQTRLRMLVDELNHRVKNTLATVQLIVSQAMQGEAAGPVRDAIEARLSALSRSHDLLTREQWKKSDLRDVILAALEPFGIEKGHNSRFSLSGDGVKVAPTAVLALGVFFHELATNALKYGALSNNKGTISIDWTVSSTAEGEALLLNWRESGGPPVPPRSHKGFGSRVIERGLSHQLGGSVALTFLQEGLECAISIPALGLHRGE